MYSPRRFQSEDINEAYELMNRYPFATVISAPLDSRGDPFISHVPLTAKKLENKIELVGHFARANSHHKVISSGITTAIFHGAHTYITPKWYTENDVPTWNYSVVHAKGRAELIDSFEGITACLQELRNHVERSWPSGWDYFVPDDLMNPEVLLKSIVGFRIVVDGINFKKKLSQNRSAEDRAGVLTGLKARSDENSHLVLQDMLDLYTLDGELK